MTQRTHRVESMSGMTPAGSYTSSRFGDCRIRVTEAYTNTALRCLRNHFARALDLGCYGNDANASLSRLPKLLKRLQRRRQQIFWWMYPTALVADERPF